MSKLFKHMIEDDCVVCLQGKAAMYGAKISEVCLQCGRIIKADLDCRKEAGGKTC